MDSLCRVCLKSSEPMMDVFAKRQLPEIELSVAEILLECIKFEVQPSDEMSSKICVDCILDVESSYRLKKNFDKTQEFIQQEENNFTNMREAEVWNAVRDDVKPGEHLENESSDLESSEESDEEQPQNKRKPGQQGQQEKKINLFRI